MREIVVFIGKLASGKSFESTKLINKGYIKLSFADTLREYCYGLLGYTPSNYDEAKTKLLYLDTMPLWATKLLKEIFPHWRTLREFLQYGADVLKKIDPLVFTNSLLKKLDDNVNSNIVIDDCRMKHELIALQKYATKNDIKLRIIFTDYRSPKYELKSIHGSEHLAEFVRDVMGKKHLDELKVENCYYYKEKGIRYKTATEINNVRFLLDSHKVDMNNLTDYEQILYNYKGE